MSQSHIQQMESRLYSDRIELRRSIEVRQKAGQTIVFTNGCFDILHRGHVEYLCRARDLGDALIVGVNSDESVRGLKGDGRPVQPLEDRMRILASLISVDYVIGFSESTPEALLSVLQPDVHTKGGDYDVQALPEAKVVQAYGGRIELIQFLDGRSSSGIIRKSQSL
ncbi:MAG: D-glycero-beta-D-manno-heptose 1-phosphate adenylyltransferase [Leptospiraceae bacterium]|nr:D-glycero-beta-D-manno-heptose 1-phosphate adenylyltransferase [Leptospiraceae bacterium]MCB1303398.1 D-glycero-beta-D-manno-heptose 1-phosphate adenylyltransferase [Leptospiraceae bacterium]